MRMPNNLYIELRDRIKENVDAKKVDIAAHRASLMPYCGKDIEKRIRWDLMYVSVGSRWVCDNIYPLGMNDTHIDTALRKIVKEIENNA
jgi:hypothetical protein